MVLSNRKLKEKLRAAITETLASSSTKPDAIPINNESRNPDPNPQPQSLKQLLDSATPKPRLSKREKKRLRTPGSEPDNSENGGANGNDSKIKEVQEGKKVREENKEAALLGLDKDGDNNTNKKRKRDEEGKNLDLVSDVGENGDSKEEGKKKKRKPRWEKIVGENGEVVKVKTGYVKPERMPMKKKKKKHQKKKAKKEEDTKAEEVAVKEEPNDDTNSQVNNQVNSLVATKVYVGGIPYSSSENDIIRYFEGCGTISEIDCMTFPDTGKFRGIAIISFMTEGAAKRALALDGSEMDGLFLKVQPYKMTKAVKVPDFAPRILEGYNKIYIGNLSWDVTEEDVRKLFSDCNISSIRFGMNKETGEFRGYAHVEFSDSMSLSMALKLDQEIVCGRPVKISCAVPKKGVNTRSKSVPASNDSVPVSDMVTKTTDNAGSVPVSGASTESTDGAGLSAVPVPVSGKIKRRTCYECGEKGHISSACPKKTADPTTNSNTS